MAGLEHYMAQYDHEHHSTWNKVLHGIGIPLIFAGAPRRFRRSVKLGLSTIDFPPDAVKCAALMMVCG